MTKQNYHVIDAHCHVYPEIIAARAVAGTEVFYDLHARYGGTVKELLDLEDREGIDRFVIQSVATTPKQVRSINDFIAETVAAHPDKLTGLGTLHPGCESLREEVGHILSLGLHGVKLHPDIQHFALDSKNSMEICALCEEAGLPLLVHAGDDRYDYSNPNRILPVLHAFPKLIVVGAHLGGYSIWEEASRKLADEPNFYVDCSSSFPFLEPEKSKAIIRRYGAERVLFGSDYPLFSPGKDLAYLLSLGFSREENELILSKNAIRVFRIT